MAGRTVRPGLAADLEFTVTAADTATAVGSGDVPVLATPRLLAWAEAATVRAIDGALPDAETSVGTSVQVQHLHGTPVGGRITVRAELTGVDGHTLRFAVSASDGSGTTVFYGTVTRVAVDREYFMAQLASP